jgi:[acyl-carrier-protein] S-malonyltransferase
VLAIVSPGQGAQSPQMLTTWLEDSKSRDLLEQMSEFVGLDLINIGTNASSDEIKNTEISQPLIISASLLTSELLDLDNLPVDRNACVVAGHSVGEFAAAKLTKALDLKTAIELVAARGKAMGIAASSNSETGMSAVLGGEKNIVIEEILKAGLVPANVNANGQIVAAGEKSKLENLLQNPPAGTRVRPLDVSAAFHTPFMTSAKENLIKDFEGMTFNNLEIKMISNRDGEFISGPQDLMSRLLSQIDSPVRWDLCQNKFKEIGVTGLLELAPAGVLAGIAKRELPEVEIFAIKSLADIKPAQEFVLAHAKKEIN